VEIAKAPHIFRLTEIAYTALSHPCHKGGNIGIRAAIVDHLDLHALRPLLLI
jgi:hypothetical protein